MFMNRRKFVTSSAAVLAATALPRAAHAQAEPIRIGCLNAMTGPLSSASIAVDRAEQWVVQDINSKGGIRGRRIEIITRDTQGDPTKSVNAAQELISRHKVHAIYGPHNSGEGLAVVPITVRTNTPILVAGTVDSLIDPVKFPNAFRPVPAIGQWDDAVRNYCLNVLRAKKVAIIGDATGYGTSARDTSVASFSKAGMEIAYAGVIDPAQPNITPDMQRMKDTGADAIVGWTASSGVAARLLNARGALGWDVPVVGHPGFGSGEVGKLITKRENWEKVYIVGFRTCSFNDAGKLPERTQAFLDAVKGKIRTDDTSLWWIVMAVDAIRLIAEAVDKTGSSDADKIIGYWNSLSSWSGLYGNYGFSPTNHNGYKLENIVMQKANSERDGAFALAPGYAA